MNIFLQALSDNNIDAIKHISKIIALAIRTEIEDFHSKYLSDDQMKELNPLIRQGVYNALFAYANVDRDSNAKKFIHYLDISMPDYWEDPMLNPQLQSIFEQFNKEPIFLSEFLKEEYKLQNFSYVPLKGCIEIKGAYDFANVNYDDRKKHLAKIRSHLMKEGYNYDSSKNGYVKIHP